MIFHPIFEPLSSTWTYLVACPSTREAVLVDPVLEEVERYVALLAAERLTLRYSLDTHLHADHVTGAAALRDRLGSRVVNHRDAGCACADVLVADGDRLRVGTLDVEVRAVPGHTSADVAYVVGDRVFTGDALLIGGCGRTDFQEGDAGRLYESIHTKLFTLPPETLVYPGHDYKGNQVSTIGRERESNARLGGGRSREDFIALMGALNLPPPKQIARALPANRACGRVRQDADFDRLPPERAWSRIGDFRVIDVREPGEFVGELGHVPGAARIPLAELGTAAEGWNRDQQLLLVCGSARRAEAGARTLLDAGFRRLAVLDGGMAEWNARGLPVER